LRRVKALGWIEVGGFVGTEVEVGEHSSMRNWIP